MLQFEILKETTHGSFSRHGGFSKAPFDSLNVSFDVGDRSEDVQANCSLIKERLGVSHLLQCEQCHGTDIHIVEDPHARIPPCDALITNMKDVGLMIKHADCQAALFFDPIQQVIAAVHAGWRGSCSRIYTKTIQVMKRKFGVCPENILVGISPSLGNAEFIHYKQELPERFWKYQTSPDHFNFWDISFDELLAAGLMPHHIEIAKKCTYTNLEYFSYRREKTTGRMGSVIVQ